MLILCILFFILFSLIAENFSKIWKLCTSSLFWFTINVCRFQFMKIRVNCYEVYPYHYMILLDVPYCINFNFFSHGRTNELKYIFFMIHFLFDDRSVLKIGTICIENGFIKLNIVYDRFAIVVYWFFRQKQGSKQLL